MSLFPAYNQEKSLEGDSTSSTSNWLVNSSFQANIISHEPKTVINVSSSDSDIQECQVVKRVEKISRKRRKKSKRKKSSKHSPKSTYELVVKNVYFDDKFRDNGNLRVDTLVSRAKPLYNITSRKVLGLSNKLGDKKISVKKFKRYFLTSIGTQCKVKKNEKPSSSIKILLEDECQVDMDNNADKAAEKRARIKEFNERLMNEPENITLWLEYAAFDSYEDESSVKKSTGKYQRMLSIVEKAIEHNPSSKDLLRKKLELMSELMPSEQLSQQIDCLLNKDPGNIVLWQALITVTNSSVALCTVPRVLKLYSKCFQSLHLWPRTQKNLYDRHLLNMLYQCLIFLRHAGLWEQMCEVIRYNLNLNLGMSKDSQDLKGTMDEKKLIDMEEVILTSQLPLNQLWLRVELLRENSHWISINRSQLELVGDSRRFITPDDVTEFVHPLLTREANLQLAVYSLLALKVPLLPLRHTDLCDFGIDETNWCNDTLESLLPMIYPCVGEMAGRKQRTLLAKGLLEGGVTSGPQYLRYHPAQELYLEFIRDTFNTIAECLLPEHKTSIYIWWLRFERMLVVLQKHDLIRQDKGFKRLKKILKEFLKKDANRNNMHYYREYALIEREFGRLSNCINILETAIESNGNTIHVQTQTEMMSVYRTLLEVLLEEKTWKNHQFNLSEFIKVFARMANGHSENESFALAEKYLYNCYREFIENSQINLEEYKGKFAMPIFTCDAVICYIYLLYIKKHEINEILEIFDSCLIKCQENPYVHEQFYESKIKFLHLYCEKAEYTAAADATDLRICLNKALKLYPNNFYLLSVLAAIESELPLWSVSSQNDQDCLWQNIAICLAGRARLHLAICSHDSATITAALNKLLHLHKKLSRVSHIRTCPLFWRLYMLLLREQNLCEKHGEEIYHESVAHCPWARCIYIDAAQVAPQFLTQVQDVVREKDLRMHQKYIPVMDAKAVVIPGEAPESDEDSVDIRTGLAFKYLTNTSGTIIAGEATESDDDGASLSSVSTAIDATASCSPLYVDANVGNLKRNFIKYNSLLHKKLYECNELLRSDILHLTEGTIISGIHELTSINKQLVKSELVVQEAACQLKNASARWNDASNALFQLIDANFFGNIKL